MTADECEFYHMGYCCPPGCLVKAGFVCPDALPMEEGDITNKCGGSNDKLMTEEEWVSEMTQDIDGISTLVIAIAIFGLACVMLSQGA